MLCRLLGKPAPALPAIPGLVHVLATEADTFTASDRDELLLSDATDREVGTLLGVSRQRANQLRKSLRERMAAESDA